MVAGHSVTVSGDLEDADHDEKDWFLLEYQKGKGLPEVIIAHIKKGIEEYSGVLKFVMDYAYDTEYQKKYGLKHR